MRSIQRYEVFRPGFIPVAANDVPALDGIAEHTHEYLEVAVISRGSGMHVTRYGSVAVSVGSVTLIRPGTWHSYKQPSDLWTFNLYLAQELLHKEFAWIVEYPALAQVLLRGDVNPGRLDESLTTRMLGWLEQIRQTPPRHEPTLLGLAACVLDTLSELTETTERDDDTSTVGHEALKMMDLMRADLTAKWTIEQLAKAIHASPAVVHRAFRTHVGLSPIAWLQQQRGELAATQLVHTDKSVSEIGRAVGWDDPNYASRRFRALYGITPTEYRKRFVQSRADPIPY